MSKYKLVHKMPDFEDGPEKLWAPVHENPDLVYGDAEGKPSAKWNGVMNDKNIALWQTIYY